MLHFTYQNATEAIRQAQLLIEDMIKCGHLQGNYAICILAHNAATIDFSQAEGDKSVELFHEKAILLVERVGDHTTWLLPYDSIAISKAQVTLRHGKPTRDVPLEEREVGDTLFFGSAIVENIIVAVSGFNPNLDEMFARIIAELIRGFALVRQTSCFKE